MGQSVFRVTETKPVDIAGGCLIDGFPSVGLASAIAIESLIRTTGFDQAGFVDSDRFPAVSVVRDGEPSYPTCVYVNSTLKVGVFSSYLALHESLHKPMARTMLRWAGQHGVSSVISSVAVKSGPGIAATGSTPEARAALAEHGVRVLEHGAIPGIPGALLNQGMASGQNVTVILFGSDDTHPDFRSSADLCAVMAKLVPGVSCDIQALQKEAERAERAMTETKEEIRNLTDGMYR